jgi:hypothetical protein
MFSPTRAAAPFGRLVLQDLSSTMHPWIIQATMPGHMVLSLSDSFLSRFAGGIVIVKGIRSPSSPQSPDRRVIPMGSSREAQLHNRGGTTKFCRNKDR